MFDPVDEAFTSTDILEAIALQNLLLAEARIDAEKAYNRILQSYTALQNQQATNFNYFTLRANQLENIIKYGTPADTGSGSAPAAPSTPDENDSTGGESLADQYQIGNFIAEGGRWTTQTFMSDHLWNGGSAHRANSGAVRNAIIERMQAAGCNVFPLVYAYNGGDPGDNWSERPGFPVWDGLKPKPVHYDQADFEHWWHWFVQIRKAGMEIVPCIFPNDARGNYNNESVYSDDDLVQLAANFITFTRYAYDGEPMCKYIVLKLEADDEWEPERIDRIGPRVARLIGPRQRLGIHNQDIDDLLRSDLSYYDFVAIQVEANLSKEETLQSCIEAIDKLPAHLEIALAEYSWNGFAEGVEVGNYLLTELPKLYPQRVFIGAWNGGR